MARSKRSFRGVKTLSGSHVGAVAKRCWCCDQCHFQSPQKVIQCPSCKASPTWLHFDSQGEAKWFATLSILQSRGKISDLQRQVPVPLQTRNPDGLMETIGKSIIDFKYVENGATIYEDYKGGDFLDPLIKWKFKHIETQYGITIRLIKGS